MENRGTLLWAAIIILAVSWNVSWAQLATTAEKSDRDRVEETHRLLAERFAAGPVEGQFVALVPGKIQFAPRSRKFPAVVVNDARQVAVPALGLLLDVEGMYDPAKKMLAVQRYRYSGQDIPQGSLALVDHSAFVEDMNEAIKPHQMGGSELGADSKSRALVNLRLSLEKKYDDAVKGSDLAKREKAVQALAQFYSARRGDLSLSGAEREEYKAIYGEEDNYPPWSYQKIYDLSRSVVAIGRAAEDKPDCSGIRIGGNYVLTAAHCFSVYQPEQLQVWFNYVDQPRNSGVEPLRFKMGRIVAPGPSRLKKFVVTAANRGFDSDMPDFAIVEINSTSVNGTAALPLPADAFCTRNCTGKQAALGQQCLKDCRRICLWKAPVERGEAVYLIGYPRRERETVHDNGRVYLAHRVHKFFLDKLTRTIEIDMSHIPVRKRVPLVQEFRNSYRPSDGDNSWLELRPERNNREPRMGVVLDTFSGNSGSPVFDRKGGKSSHCVIGILAGGAIGTPMNAKANWQLHESVLPMTAIFANLKADPETEYLTDPSILAWRGD